MRNIQRMEGWNEEVRDVERKMMKDLYEIRNTSNDKILFKGKRKKYKI